MKDPGSLYLIPSMLGESPIIRIIPPFNTQVISRLKYFIVEEIKTARRFLKKVYPEIDFETISFLVNNEHSSGKNLSSLIDPLLNGEDMGLLSEAGMPCIADPGAEIVSLAHQHHVKIIPLTGPSSLLLSLMASGFNGQNFAFHGYLPIDKSERIKKIRELEKSVYSNDQTQIFIEAPYRNSQLFQSITEVCSDNTLLCIATDLTMESETIKVQTIRNWKGKNPGIHKKPTIFLLYR
jgi:16S rRNA (cytidine1402-2'-O)-methyltransferase